MCNIRSVSRPALALICALFLALGAPGAGALDWRPLSFKAPSTLEDIHGLPGRDGSWLLATSYGLALLENGQTTLLHSGRFEQIDMRGAVTLDGKQITLVSAVDVEAGAVALFALSGAGRDLRLDALTRIDLDRDIPDAQCLYHNPQSGHIALFVADTRGHMEQRYIYDARRQMIVDVPIRRFVGVVDAQACAVNDFEGELYLAEQSLGVWRLNAHAERDLERAPVLLRELQGGLRGEVGDIALDSVGTLWVLDEEHAAVHRLPRDGRGSRESVPGLDEANFLALASQGSSLALTVYSEDQEQLLEARSTLPGSIRSFAPHSGIHARLQTDPVARFGDAADDPAIFVDPRDASQSLILGTDKRAGLAVYGLDGRLRQFLPIGRLNNVDVITGVSIAGKSWDLAVASNRSNDNISVFQIADGRLKHLGNLPTGLRDVYGLCAFRSRQDGAAYVFINSTNGRYEQYRLSIERRRPTGEMVRGFALPSQPEGCAVDVQTSTVYLGEEEGGIWRAGAGPDADDPVRIIEPGRRLVPDVEGIDVYRDESGAYLVVSSQGSNSYLVYGLETGFPVLTQFEVKDHIESGIDGTSETDGLAVSSATLPGFPRGILVVQDGRNRMPDAPQNFKILDWRDIAAGFRR